MTEYIVRLAQVVEGATGRLLELKGSASQNAGFLQALQDSGIIASWSRSPTRIDGTPNHDEVGA